MTINYHFSLKERIQLFGGFGVSMDILSSYSEYIKGIQTPLGQPNATKIHTEWYINKNEGYAKGEREREYWENKYSEWIYNKYNLSMHLHLGMSYNISDRLELFIKAKYMKGLKDIENKKEITETSTTVYNGLVTSIKYNYWNETNYRRYYYRWEDKYNQRKETYTQAIGLCVGINYYFKGGLLPSIHK